jgi:hypothetical protein
VLPTEPSQITGAHVIDLSEYRTKRSLSAAIPIVATAAAAVLIVLGLWGWFSTRNEINNYQTQLARSEADLVSTKDQLANVMKQLETQQASLNIPPDYVPYVVAGQEAQPNASGVVFINPKTSDVELVAQGLNPLPDSKVYEMWWVPKDNSAPVKAGTFQPDASGVARHAAKPPASLDSYKAIAVSEEQAPGVDQAQGPIVLLGIYPTP